MPSTTRGSILISTANDIGEALVEKLGGVGYSPNEWKEKYNLCGIAPVDSAPALSVLADSAGTGDERGSILIATADAIGAILNKKYNVLRGFKPKEWASACRKMKALEEGSVASSPIASFSDGADDVPTKSLVVTIPPTLDGKSEVTETQTGRNLLLLTDGTYTIGYTGANATILNGKISVTGTTVNSGGRTTRLSDYFVLHAGTYYISPVISTSPYVRSYLNKKSDNTVVGYSNGSAFTISEDTEVYFGINIESGKTYNTTLTPQVEYGSTAHAYEPYTAPTTYTASLGRTIYGGTADVVKGEGSEENTKFTVTADMADSIRYIGSGNTAYIQINKTLASNSRWQDLVCSHFTPANIYAGGTQQGIGCYSAQFYIRDSRFTSKQDFIDFLDEQETLGTPLEICYKLATPTDFTFDGQEINTRLGYNAFWSDSGDTAVEYYKAPTPYTRKTATGGIANFSDQRTDLPLTKAIVNIAPSISGKSAVNLVRAGKNLYNIDEAEYNGEFYDASGNVVQYADCAVSWIKVNPSTKYSFSCSKESSQSVNVRVAWCKSDKSFISRQGLFSDNQFPMTLTTPSNCEWLQLSVNQYGASSIAQNNWSIQVEQSETSTTFSPYNGETYTAELGETVYGGSVDFVSGEVVKEQDITTLTNGGWTYYATGGKNTFNKIISGAEAGEIGLLDGYTFEQVSYISQQSDKCFYFYASGASVRISIRDDAYTSAEEFAEHINGEKLVYTLATPTESAIPGRVISPIEGVNNYWNDAGGDTEIQYFESET